MRFPNLSERATRTARVFQGYLYDDTPMPGLGYEMGCKAVAGDLGVSVTSWTGATHVFAEDPVQVHPFVQRMAEADGWNEEMEDEDREDELWRGTGGSDRGAPHFSAIEGKADSEKEGKRNDAIEENRGELDEGLAEGSSKKLQEEAIVIEDNSVRFWSDFLKVHLHPRSCHDLSQGMAADYSCFATGMGPSGLDVGTGGLVVQEWEDNLHWWTEECDTLQGFHVWADADTSMGAAAARVCEALADDFPHAPVLLCASATHCVQEKDDLSSEEEKRAWAEGAARRKLQQQRRLAGEALTLAAATELGAIHVPFAGNFIGASETLQVWNTSWFRSAAHVAAGIDTATLPWRLRRGGGHGPTGSLLRAHGLFGRFNVLSCTSLRLSAIDIARCGVLAAMPGPSAPWQPLRLSPRPIQDLTPGPQGSARALGTGMGSQYTRTLSEAEAAVDAGGARSNALRFAVSVTVRG
jgi:hypothetical protein